MIYYYAGKLREGAFPIDPAAPGFRYGAGFFETICYNGSVLCHLDRHLDRLFHALRDHAVPHRSIDFEAAILRVLAENGLSESFARVNIVYPMREPEARPVVMAAPFEPAPHKAYRLCVCSDRHVSALNAYKTTSYMFFHLARRQAQAIGFDDAVLLDLNDNLLESSTGAILLKRQGEYFEMDSPYKLPSTALALAGEVLDVVPATVPLGDLGQYRHAYLLNSLIGMRPIVSIGENAFIPDEGPCQKVTDVVLER
ncbi:aminotransferase IV [Pseudodesulfovibrio cashew]|uniref:Aminotransferase IV n=1 Tax=Pseudodesulfovibrio cashew TaxID=2678688 RepID=A0A6I6JPD5_9BACT|nr:aminotransferase class IV [Pseudodesulfovibrio cashew]QGY39484.1 aminotransferase IV [Pseudodesulfovibrio cashew]